MDVLSAIQIFLAGFLTALASQVFIEWLVARWRDWRDFEDWRRRR